MEHKEAKNNQSEKQEEKRTPPNEDTISSIWTTLRGPTFTSQRGEEEQEKEREIGNLFEKIMKENFPNLVKEIDMQVQKAQSPKQDGCEETHSKTHPN